ncbi:MAG: hypothetical protein JNL82_28305 [Myxococcales bacterium]|nr:hypothetical protein [Myxococcales bacterium]
MARELRDVRLAVHLPLHYSCGEDYDAMSAAAGGRRCGACDRVVVDLSAMSEREAARFMARPRERRACISYEVRDDGRVVYRRPRPSRLAPGLVAAALTACAPHEPPPRIEGAQLEVEAPAPAPVVVPARTMKQAEPRPEPPDDDINPCPPPQDEPPDVAETKRRKTAPSKPATPGRRRVVGIEG